MATKKKALAKITLRTVLEHVQALHGEMLAKFATVDKRFEAVDKRFDAVDVRIDRVERNLTRQIDGIDKRLDDIEIREIPQLKKAVAVR